MTLNPGRLLDGIGMRLLPAALAGSAGLPPRRLLRLSLFQISVGMSVALVVGTLNRVMIVELGVPARLVALMIALPLLLAPLRAVVGFRSDTHRSFLGWRRVPFLWLGTMVQFGGLAMMPFALLLLSGIGGGHKAPVAGGAAAAMAFLMIGAGLHTTQTVGLALATDLAPAHARPLVVSILCGMLLLGVLASALLFGVLLRPFGVQRLIGVIQGAALATLALNALALFRQEPRDATRVPSPRAARPSFLRAWHEAAGAPGAWRRFVAVACGTVAFGLQDVLLEPYGGLVLGLPVAATTALTGSLAAGGLAGFAFGFRLLRRGADRHRVAATGVLIGIAAFSCVLASGAAHSTPLFAAGTALIGASTALFASGTLSGAVDATGGELTGLALGAWGAVQAVAAGVATALGGGLRDAASGLAASGALGPALRDPATGYGCVWALELFLLFVTLVVLGPLVRFRTVQQKELPA